MGGTLVASLISLGSIPLLTRLYGPNSFGTFSSAFVIASAASFLATGGQEIELYSASALDIGSMVSGCYRRSAVVGTMALVISAVVLQTWSSAQVSIWLLAPIASLSVSLLRVETTVLLRTGRARRVGQTRVIYGVVSTVCQVGLGLCWRSPGALLLGLALGNLAAWVWCRPDLRYLLVAPRRSRSWATGLATAISNIGVNAPVVVLAATGFDAAAGAYSVASRGGSMLLTVVVQPLGQLLASDIGQRVRDHGPLRPALRRSILSTSAVGIALIPIMLVAAAYVTAIFGDRWSGLGPMILAILPAAVAQLSFSNCTQVLGVLARGRELFLWEATRSGIGVALLASLLALGLSDVTSVVVFGVWVAVAYIGLFLLVRRGISENVTPPLTSGLA